jgi:pyruvate/oxaloacetate carboxyltransferase/biotin carboxyl carrier protein
MAEKKTATKKAAAAPATRLMVMDTTLRDGHQSTLATRMRWEDIEAVAEKIDRVGYVAVEVWGGATFDVLHRFLGEDPWERSLRLKKLMPRSPFQMLLRGQNLVGYRHYADDVVRAFVHKAAEVGIERFRVFDALNDERNFEAAFTAIKETGQHIQGAISFSLTEPKIGGPVFTMDYYMDKFRRLADMGADSLCIKDMAGILSPYDAFTLVSTLKARFDLPVQLHTHYTAGTGSMTYLKAVEAGVDIIDCAISPFALRTSQPAIEPILCALQGTPRDTGLDLAKIVAIAEMIEKFAPKYRHLLNTSKMSIIDSDVLVHQIPGGMTSNMVNQLREMDALDRLDEVYKELPETRRQLGYPPLVTPTSQIVGAQSVMNVIAADGRWSQVSQEIKDLCFGLYGRPPAPIDAEVQRKVLKGYKRGETPITCRPADILEPEMEKAKADVADLTVDEGDVLIYALYPRTGRRFLEFKHGKAGPLPEWKAKSLDDVKREDDLVRRALKGELVPKDTAPGVATGTYTVQVDGETFEVLVAAGDAGALASLPKPKPAAARPAVPVTKPKAASAMEPTKVDPVAGCVVKAPMPGTIIRYDKKVGDAVVRGETVLVLEAMKMENAINASCAGTVIDVPCKAGDTVQRGTVLMVIET